MFINFSIFGIADVLSVVDRSLSLVLPSNPWCGELKAGGTSMFAQTLQLQRLHMRNSVWIPGVAQTRMFRSLIGRNGLLYSI